MPFPTAAEHTARLLMEEVNATLHNSTDSNHSSNDASSNAVDIIIAVVSNFLLFFTIFALSASVNFQNFKRQWRNKFAIGTGVAMQFLIMPALGFIAVMALRDQGLTQAMGITLLVVTSSPGGSYSNWWCSTFNADLALSVTMTSISSFISIGMLPANLFLYTYLAYGVFASDNADNETDSDQVVQALDFKTIFITLGVVMGAILSGLLAGFKWDTPSFHICANRLGSVCGLLLVVFSVLISFGGGGNDKEGDQESAAFFSHSWAFYVGVAFPCLVGIALANIISRSCFHLSPPECVTLSIECCYQNVGIATSVAVTMFQDNPTERAQAIAVPLFYGVVEAVAIGIYCVWAWKAGWTKAPKEEKLCVVVTKTYEVEEDEMEEIDDSEKQDGEPMPTETDLTDTPDKTVGNRCRIISEDNTSSTCCTAVSFASPEHNNTANLSIDDEYVMGGSHDGTITHIVSTDDSLERIEEAEP